jgi:carbon-monoxide dehydrogenase medium subunit
VKPVDFQYHRPTEVAQAVRLLSELGDDAKILAGGQSLLPIMNMRLAEPSHLIDITGIRELKDYSISDSCARYGATTTHMMLEDGLVPDVTRGLLPNAAAGIGYRAIRCRGTLAGSLAHSDSSAEWPTVLSALDAVVHVESVRGKRQIPVRKLLQGFFSTTLESDELIVEVEIPRLDSDVVWGLFKVARKVGEFAESLAIALRGPSGDELWLGAARDVPIRLDMTESVVSGRSSHIMSVADLVAAVGADTGSKGHRCQLHASAVHRALRNAERKEAHV